jgi:hypothetical protein
MALSTKRSVVVAAACGTLLVGVAAGPAVASTSGSSARPVVVASGLNNPRGLEMSGNTLLVAEAGKGGHVVTVNGPEGALGLGFTGSVSAIAHPARGSHHRAARIVSGLLSGAAPTSSDQGPKGSSATGPDGVAVGHRALAIIETTFGPATPAAGRRNDGQLLLATHGHSLRPFANITGYEAQHDPDGHGVDSDPYAVITYGRGWLVADAAGNDLLRVGPTGAISVFHVFPNVTGGACAGQFDPAPPFAGCNFVPTSMTTDRWGNVYVGGLSSLTPGAAQVLKLSPRGHVLHIWRGFTAVTGVAVAHDGTLYLSQLFAPEQHPANPIIQGVVTRIHNGHRTSRDVPFPAALLLSGRNLYVSAFSILPSAGAGIPGVDTSGQVWRMAR